MMSTNATFEAPFPATFNRLKQLDGSLDIYTIGLLSSALVILASLGTHLFHRTDKDGFPFSSGLPIVGSWKFFTTRYRFLHDGMAKLGNAYSFKILQVRTCCYLCTKSLSYIFISTIYLSYRERRDGKPFSDTKTSISWRVTESYLERSGYLPLFLRKSLFIFRLQAPKMTDIKAEKVDEPEDSVNIHDFRYFLEG